MARFSKWTRLFDDEIPRYLASRDKKSLFRQAREILTCLKVYREIPYHYLTHSLYLKTTDGNLLDFIPTQILHRVQTAYNPRDSFKTADDKSIFSRIMREAGVPVAADLFFVARDGVIQTADRVTANYDTMTARLRDEGVRSVFAKPTGGGNGKATFRLDVTENGLSNRGKVLSADEFVQLIFGPDTPFDWHEFVIQTLIEQHAMLKSFHAEAVCTVRIDTLIQGEHIDFIAAALRVGRPGQVTDGWTLGGFMIPIDLGTGRLMAPARVKPRNWKMYGAITLDRHPANGMVFDGMVLPHWQGVLDNVEKAAWAMMPLRSVGWDIAIAEDGPVMVEANHDYDMFMQQEAARGLRPTPLGKLALALNSGQASA